MMLKFFEGYKSLIVLLFTGVLLAGELFIATPANKKTGKSDLIPAKIIKNNIQKIWGNPIFNNIIPNWGKGSGAAAVLGPYSIGSLINWDSIYGYFAIYGLWPTYDITTTLYYWGGIQVEDTFAAWFKIPGPCTVVAFGISLYNPSQENVPTAIFNYGVHFTRADVNPFFVSPDSATPGRGTYPDTEASGFGHYVDYYYLTPADRINYYGPRPFDLNNPITAPSTGNVGQETQLFVFNADTPIEITDTSQTFFLWMVPQSQGQTLGMLHPLGSAWTSRDQLWHCWITAPNRIGSPGWFNFPHGFLMDAFVWLYETIHLKYFLEQLPWTFSTGPFTVHVKFNLTPSLISSCTLQVKAIPASPQFIDIPGIPDNQDSTIWKFDIGPFSIGDTVYYRLKNYTINGNLYQGDTNYIKKFVIIYTDPTDIVLFVDEDQDTFTLNAYQILNRLIDYTDGIQDGTPSAFFWDVNLMGPPDESVLDVNKFKAVFWIGWGPAIFASDTINIKNYLDSGGNLFISSQDLVVGGFAIGNYTTEINFITDYPNHFCKTYLKMGRVLDDIVGTIIPSPDTFIAIYGFPGDTISDYDPTFWAPMDSTIYYGFEGNNWIGYVFPDDLGNGVYDTVFPCWFLEKGLTSREDGTPVGYWYDGTQYGDNYRLVLFYFNYQYLIDSVVYDTSQKVYHYVFDSYKISELTKRILEFFGFPTINIKETPKNSPEKLKISFILPNIVKSKINITYSISEKGLTIISIFDKSGRKIKEIQKYHKNKGSYALSIPLKTLPSGTYFLNFKFKNKKIVKKFVKIK